MRREVPPPTPATVYELTERGYALQPTILELSRWGRPLLRQLADDQLPYSALLLGLKTAFHQEAAADLDETYDIEVGDQRVSIHVHGGALDVTPGRAAEPTLRIITDRQGFMDLARGHPGDRVRIEGDAEAMKRLQQIFSLA
jgi:SCP-2 sterol transfer family